MSLHLNKLQSFHGRKGPLLLIIMDGIGLGKADETNAVYRANTPNLDQLLKSDLSTQLKAHGTAVGLPSDDDMGNSEVGHTNIGAGRIIYQNLLRISNAISDGSFFENEAFVSGIKR